MRVQMAFCRRGVGRIDADNSITFTRTHTRVRACVCVYVCMYVCIMNYRATYFSPSSARASIIHKARKQNTKRRVLHGRSSRGHIQCNVYLIHNHTERYCYRCVVFNTIHNLMRRNPTVAIQSTGTGTLCMSYTPHTS